MKVKGDELRPIFGDGWLRKCNGKVQLQALNYQRSSWSSILNCSKRRAFRIPVQILSQKPSSKGSAAFILCSKRSTRAKQHGVPKYIVFHFFWSSPG
ncbi:hypothetical protein ACFXTH_023763 [Malus domestica]